MNAITLKTIICAASLALFSCFFARANEIEEQLTEELDEIQTALYQTPALTKEEARAQLTKLRYLQETYKDTTEFQDEGFQSWYKALEDEALRLVNKADKKPLKPSRLRGEKLGTLEVVIVGAGQQVIKLFVNDGDMKLAVATPVNAAISLAKEIGIQKISDLNGQEVIFNHNHRGDMLTYAGKTYKLVNLVRFK